MSVTRCGKQRRVCRCEVHRPKESQGARVHLWPQPCGSQRSGSRRPASQWRFVAAVLALVSTTTARSQGKEASSLRSYAR
jgi:hypothetical protein